MNLDRVREKLANGFRPFVLELFGGQRVRVVHPELGQHSSTPFQLLSLANCTTNSSTDRSRRGRPRVDRCLEPSNFLATSFRCQARIVSGRTIRATSSSALRPKRWPILARVMRSASLRRSRPLTWFLRIPCSLEEMSPFGLDRNEQASRRQSSIFALFACRFSRFKAQPAWSKNSNHLMHKVATHPEKGVDRLPPIV